jgi:lambda family phage portal protein
MISPVQFLGADGQPLVMQQNKAAMLVGGGRTPYDAADLYSEHMADWSPFLWSPDGELNPYRDRIVSRVRDLVKNDGWASAAITRTLDSVIGADFRPIAKPDYQALKAMTGIKGFDHVWADEFGEAVEAHWRTWAYDTGKWCDTERNLTVAQMMRLGFRHKIVDGDALGILYWLPERIGYGRARYATALQIIDPDRLSNPQLRFDQHTMRGGVEIDGYGAATAYHIRKAHQGDWFSAAESLQWERIERETSWGRPIVVHDYDHDRAGQHRGGVGILSPVVQRLKMLIKYDGTELDASIVNAIFGAYIESPFDHQFVEQALGGEGEELNAYQGARVDFHRDRAISLSGSRMPILFPGEKINAVTAARPNGNFAEFENAMLRNVAAGTGLSTQQISQNWSDVNYSSYRAAMLEAWKTIDRRRTDFAIGFGTPIYGAFLEECMDVEDLPLPAGAPSFLEAKGAYSRAKWMGPGRGNVDPVKERQGAIMGIASGLSTLEDENADASGADWRDVMNQRALEIERAKKLGVELNTTVQPPDKDLGPADPDQKAPA